MTARAAKFETVDTSRNQALAFLFAVTLALLPVVLLNGNLLLR